MLRFSESQKRLSEAVDISTPISKSVDLDLALDLEDGSAVKHESKCTGAEEKIWRLLSLVVGLVGFVVVINLLDDIKRNMSSPPFVGNLPVVNLRTPAESGAPTPDAIADSGAAAMIDNDEFSIAIATLQKQGNSSFMNIYVDPESSDALYVQVPADSLMLKTPFMVTCVVAKGTYFQGEAGGQQMSLLHEPCESKEYNVFHFEQNVKIGGVLTIDLVQDQNQIRLAPGVGVNTSSTAVDGSKPNLEASAWDGWVSSLPVVATEYFVDTDGTNRSKSHLLKISSLAAKGFFVSDMVGVDDTSVRILPSATKTYAKNSEVTIEFQQAIDKSDKDTGFIPLAFRYSLRQLPRIPMPSRVADNRVGFFTLSYNQLGGDSDKGTNPEDGSNAWRRRSEWLDRRVTVINRRSLLWPPAPPPRPPRAFITTPTTATASSSSRLLRTTMASTSVGKLDDAENSQQYQWLAPSSVFTSNNASFAHGPYVGTDCATVADGYSDTGCYLINPEYTAALMRYAAEENKSAAGISRPLPSLPSRDQTWIAFDLQQPHELHALRVTCSPFEDIDSSYCPHTAQLQWARDLQGPWSAASGGGTISGADGVSDVRWTDESGERHTTRESDGASGATAHSVTLNRPGGEALGTAQYWRVLISNNRASSAVWVTEVQFAGKERTAAQAIVAQAQGQRQGRRTQEQQQQQQQKSSTKNPVRTSLPYLRYFIDPSVPAQWRGAMKCGVEKWNKAFAAAGYSYDGYGESNAAPGIPAGPIRGVLPGDPDWPADYDAGDMRYNSISWAVDLTRTFALGPSSVDPRSGQILNSDIIFTSSWVKVWTASLARWAPFNPAPPTEESSGSPEPDGAADYTDAARPAAALRDPEEVPRARAFSVLSGEHHSLEGGWAPLLMEHAALRESLQMQQLQAQAQQGGSSSNNNATEQQLYKNIEAIMHAGLCDVAAHEVGHTLGLRHNFIASASKRHSYSQLGNLTHVLEHGLSESVMDYNAMNVRSAKQQKEDVKAGRNSGNATANQDLYFMRDIGAYDIAAIKYGYQNPLGQIAWPSARNEQFSYDEELSLSTQSGDPVLVPSSSRDTPNGQLGVLTASAFDVDDSAGLPAALRALARATPAFQTDEDVQSSHPYAQRHDLATEPLDYYADRLQLVREMRDSMLHANSLQGQQEQELGASVSEKVVRDGDSWERWYAMERVLLGTIRNAAKSMSMYIGGVHFSKAHRGDAPKDKHAAPVRAVSVEQQRRVMGIVMEQIIRPHPPHNSSSNASASDFDASTGLFPPAWQSDYMVERAKPEWCSGVVLFDYCYGQKAVDMAAKIVRVREEAMDALFDEARLHRVAAQAAQSPFGNAMTVSEMLDLATRKLWGGEADSYSNSTSTGSNSTASLVGVSNTLVESANWPLQAAWVKKLLSLRASKHADVNAGAYGELLALTDMIKSVEAKLASLSLKIRQNLQVKNLRGHLKSQMVAIGKELDAETS